MIQENICQKKSCYSYKPAILINILYTTYIYLRHPIVHHQHYCAILPGRNVYNYIHMHIYIYIYYV